MPLGPEYDKQIDSKFADMKNIGGATAVRSRRRSSCSASSIRRHGRISISRGRRWGRRRRRSIRAGGPASAFACWTGWSRSIYRSHAMTEVLFYHLQDMTLENCCLALLEKLLARGWRVVVQSTSEERADALDAHLWTYREDLFLPHATWRAGDVQDQPIVLAVAEGNPNPAMSHSWSTTPPCRRIRMPTNGWCWCLTATTTTRLRQRAAPGPIARREGSRLPIGKPTSAAVATAAIAICRR